MGEYTEECINTFLMNQGQLFDEPVAENYDEAEAFLEDCLAVVADNLDDVRALDYFDRRIVPAYHALELGVFCAVGLGDENVGRAP